MEAKPRPNDLSEIIPYGRFHVSVLDLHPVGESKENEGEKYKLCSVAVTKSPVIVPLSFSRIQDCTRLHNVLKSYL